MEEAIRIGGYSWRGECNQRTERRRLAFERKFLEQPSINIRVRGGLSFHQVPAGLYVYGGRCRPDFKTDVKLQWHRRAYIHILGNVLKPGSCCRYMIVVIGHVLELKSSFCVGAGSAAVSGNRVLNLNN